MGKLNEIMSKFPFGTNLLFNNILVPKYIKEDKKLKRVFVSHNLSEDHGRALEGLVVGATYVQEGVYNEGYHDMEDYAPAFLTEIKTILVLLVKIQYRGAKFYMVKPEGVLRELDHINVSLPLQGTMTDEVKEYMSKDMKEFMSKHPPARDSKGRFV